MNALFPKTTTGLDFSDNDFLQAGGKYALPFSDSDNTLTSENTIF